MSKSKTRKQKDAEERELRIKPINVFTCSCDNIQREFPQFQVHLTQVHGLTPDQFRGKKSMISHIDYARSYSSHYQWELEAGLKFQQYVEIARDKNDPMYHND